MKKIMALGILFSCMSGWIYAATLTDAVQYKVNDDIDKINDAGADLQNTNRLMQDLLAKVAVYNAQIQADQAIITDKQDDIENYNALTPSAMQADDNIKGIVDQIGMDPQGTLKSIR